MQYQAGLLYREKCSLIARSGKDSTMQLLVSGGGSPTNLTDAQCDASTWKVHVNFLMTKQHRHIVNQVCDRDVSPAKAVRMILPNEGKNVTRLFQDALEGLAEAIIKKNRLGANSLLTISENG